MAKTFVMVGKLGDLPMKMFVVLRVREELRLSRPISRTVQSHLSHRPLHEL